MPFWPMPTLEEASVNTLAILLAVAVIALVVQDAFEVMLLPRRVHRRVRLVRGYYRVSWKSWRWLAMRVPASRRRENILSHFGPLSVLGLFGAWATCLIGGFGLLEWALRPPSGATGGNTTLPEQLYMSGVTFFTLGYGDIVPHSGSARLVTVVEAGTGLGFIAIVIGYLPVLYQLFARREAYVIQLDGRAGSPPTAVALLCRHAEADGLPKLDELLRDWEFWSAELLESHLSYPMLAYYRSQHDNQSWLAAIVAVMDCCALILVGGTELAPLQARMTFSMTRQVVVELARSFRIQPSRYDGGDRLTPDAFARMRAEFEGAGLTWDAEPDAEQTLRALRSTYEPLLDGLARYLLLPLPSWLAAEDSADHWEGGHRGLLARRLVEQLASPTTPVVADDGASPWRKLHRRLRG